MYETFPPRTSTHTQEESGPTHPQRQKPLPLVRHMTWSMFGSGQLLATIMKTQRQHKDLGNRNPTGGLESLCEGVKLADMNG